MDPIRAQERLLLDALLRVQPSAGARRVFLAQGEEQAPACGWRHPAPTVLVGVGGRLLVSFPARGALVSRHPLGCGEALYLPGGTWRHIEPGAGRSHLWLILEEEAMRVALKRRRPGETGKAATAEARVEIPGLRALRPLLDRTAANMVGLAMVPGLLDAILAQAVQGLEALVPAPAADRRAGTWEAVADHLAAHCHERIGRFEVATALGLSPDYLSHLCRERTGSTLTGLLNDLRVAAAARLLAEGGMGLAAIAASCGFSSPGYLIAQFRRRHGCTPLAYRRLAHRRRSAATGPPRSD